MPKGHADTNEFEKARKEYLSSLDLAVTKGARRWLESGHQIVVTNLCALLDYDLATNVLMRAKTVTPRHHSSFTLAMCLRS